MTAFDVVLIKPLQSYLDILKGKVYLNLSVRYDLQELDADWLNDIVTTETPRGVCDNREGECGSRCKHG